MEEVVRVLEKILTEIKDLRRDFNSEMDSSKKYSSMGKVLERLNGIQGEASEIKSEASAILRKIRD